MDLFKGKSSQALQTSMNRAAMYNTNRPLECNTDGTNIVKSEGEGSRGGKVIGHTTSGKPIYGSFDHAAHKDFSAQDHADAAHIHSHAAIVHSIAGDKGESSNRMKESLKHSDKVVASVTSKGKDEPLSKEEKEKLMKHFDDARNNPNK